MWLLVVNPISRGIPKEHLYYFSSERVEEGDLIEVPLRSRIIVAKVDSVRAVIDAKAELKTLPFEIRKIATLRLPNFFSPAFMAAANDVAEFFSSTLGATLYSLLPPKKLLPILEGNSLTSNLKDKKNDHAVYVMQSADEERVAAYRRLIREEFAKKKSVYLIMPTIAEAVRAFAEISKGLSDYGFLLHQRMPKRLVGEIWKKAFTSPHPILLVATPLFLGLPRDDVGTIAIERESAKNYKKESRPFIDYRIFARFLGKHLGARVILGDSMVRSETFNELELSRSYEYGKNSFRFTSSVPTKILPYEKDRFRRNQVSICPDLIELINENKNVGGRTFILSPRRGLASRTVCRDCGKSVSCLKCGGTLVLHSAQIKNSPEKTIYLCHRCGEEVETNLRCVRCNSWDLSPLGVGSEKIETELKNAIPDAKLFRADRDTALRDQLTNKILEKFLATPGGVLIGTELALTHLRQKVELSAILFPELLSAAPEYSADEETLRLILRVKSLADKKFVVQTADLEMPIIFYSENANLMDFYRKELETRKILNYPPFSHLILLSWKPTEETKKQIETTFASYSTTFFEGWLVGEKKADKALIRLKPNEWPDKVLREKLLSLPMKVKVEVGPERIFG